MSLLETLRADALVARKARDTHKATFLVTLLAEAEKVGKDKGNRASTDAEVVAVVRKLIDNLDDAIGALWVPQKLDTDTARVKRRLDLMLEQGYAQVYLPAQASASEVAAHIEEVVGGMAERSLRSIGFVMMALDSKFSGNYDRARASTAVRAALTAPAASTPASA